MENNSEEISILLLTEDYPIKPFDCEDEDLNDFLFQEAGFEFLTKLNEEMKPN